MKRIVLSLLLILAALAAFAGDKTGRAATMIPQIKNYLAQEGYVASLDSDNDLKFKSEGDSYYISVQNYDDGCYIDVYTLSDISGLNINNIRTAADQTQTSLKFVRMDVLSDETMSVGVVGFYSSLADFKLMFSNIIDIIHRADKRFIEKLVDLSK